MWKRLGLGAALLLALGGGWILIDQVSAEPLAAASSNTDNRATRNMRARRHRRRHRSYRRTKGGSKNM
jgi:hypothetical protein